MFLLANLYNSCVYQNVDFFISEYTVCLIRFINWKFLINEMHQNYFRRRWFVRFLSKCSLRKWFTLQKRKWAIQADVLLSQIERLRLKSLTPITDKTWKSARWYRYVPSSFSVPNPWVVAASKTNIIWKSDNDVKNSLRRHDAHGVERYSNKTPNSQG